MIIYSEKKISKSPSRGTIYKNPMVSYVSTESEDSQYASMDAAEIIIDKPYVCKALAQIHSKDTKTRSVPEEINQAPKVYTFDITKVMQFLTSCCWQRSSNFGHDITFLRLKS
ncbi:hypothetical protein COP2_044906 [Malus domestica]